jgi:hypothetical protein
VFSNPEAVSTGFSGSPLRWYCVYRLFSAFSLSVHQERQEKLFSAIESRFMLMSDEFTTQELEYIDTLKPTSYWLKIGALVLADMFVIAVIWINPRNRQKIEKVKKG